MPSTVDPRFTGPLGGKQNSTVNRDARLIGKSKLRSLNWHKKGRISAFTYYNATFLNNLTSSMAVKPSGLHRQSHLM